MKTIVMYKTNTRQIESRHFKTEKEAWEAVWQDLRDVEEYEEEEVQDIRLEFESEAARLDRQSELAENRLRIESGLFESLTYWVAEEEIFVPEGHALMSEQSLRQIADECDTAKRREWNADGHGVLKSLELIQGIVPEEYHPEIFYVMTEIDMEETPKSEWDANFDHYKTIDDAEDEAVSGMLVDETDTEYVDVIVNQHGEIKQWLWMKGGVVWKKYEKDGEAFQVFDYDDLP